MEPHKRHSRQYWEEILAEQATSGQTATGFCRERAITPSSFFSAKKRQRLAHSKAITTAFPARPAPFEAQKTVDSVPATRAAFVAVQVAEPSGDDGRTASAIRVQLRSGHHLWVASEFDSSHLRRLVSVLESA